MRADRYFVRERWRLAVGVMATLCCVAGVACTSSDGRDDGRGAREKASDYSRQLSETLERFAEAARTRDVVALCDLVSGRARAFQGCGGPDVDVGPILATTLTRGADIAVREVAGGEASLAFPAFQGRPNYGMATYRRGQWRVTLLYQARPVTLVDATG